MAPKVRIGSKPFPNTLFQNATIPADYCDHGTTGVMRLDSATSACWFNATQSFIPAVRFAASSGDNNDNNDNNDGDGGGDNNGDSGGGN